jgi:copper chaperone NosL
VEKGFTSLSPLSLNRSATLVKVKIFSLLAAGFIVATFFSPIWSLQLEAPQYETEGPLKVYAYVHKVEGDIFELAILNEYIGAHFPEKVPEQKIFPVALVLSVILLLLVPFMAKSKKGLFLKPALGLLIIVAVLGPAVLQWRLYQFGHDRDPNPPLIGIPDFTVPLLGPSKFANWDLFSNVQMGTFTLGIALVLTAMAFFWLKRGSSTEGKGT